MFKENTPSIDSEKEIENQLQTIVNTLNKDRGQLPPEQQNQFLSELQTPKNQNISELVNKYIPDWMKTILTNLGISFAQPRNQGLTGGIGVGGTSASNIYNHKKITSNPRGDEYGSVEFTPRVNISGNPSYGFSDDFKFTTPTMYVGPIGSNINVYGNNQTIYNQSDNSLLEKSGEINPEVNIFRDFDKRGFIGMYGDFLKTQEQNPNLKKSDSNYSFGLKGTARTGIGKNISLSGTGKLGIEDDGSVAGNGKFSVKTKMGGKFHPKLDISGKHRNNESDLKVGVGSNFDNEKGGYLGNMNFFIQTGEHKLLGTEIELNQSIKSSLGFVIAYDYSKKIWTGNVVYSYHFGGN